MKDIKLRFFKKFFFTFMSKKNKLKHAFPEMQNLMWLKPAKTLSFDWIFHDFLCFSSIAFRKVRQIR